MLRRGFGSTHRDRRAPSQAASPMSSRAGLLAYGVADETAGKQAFYSNSEIRSERTGSHGEGCGIGGADRLGHASRGPGLTEGRATEVGRGLCLSGAVRASTS